MIKTSATITLQYDTVFSPFWAAEFAESLSWLRAEGFDSAEICISDPRKVDGDLLIRQLESHGLQVSTISTGQARTQEGLSLTDGRPEVRARAVQRVQDHIRLARQINSSAVTIGLLRGVGSAGKMQEELDLLHAAMAECVAFACEEGIRLLLEPINRYETNLLTNVDDTIDFIEQMGNPTHVGVLYDIFHANIEEQSISRSVERLGNKLFHVHFADSNRWLPGMGHIDYGPIIASLRKINYQGYASLEVLNFPNAATVKNEAGARLAACLQE